MSARNAQPSPILGSQVPVFAMAGCAVGLNQGGTQGLVAGNGPSRERFAGGHRPKPPSPETG